MSSATDRGQAVSPPGPRRARVAALAAPLVAVAVIVALGLMLLGPLAGRASGHTDLLQGSPGPGQRVGGTVDFVDLVFVGPVSDVVIEVTDPDGQVVDGTMEVADGQIIHFRMDAIETTGRHVVSYEMVSEDGDLTSASYFFTYEADATQPFRLGELDVPDPPSETAATIRTVATVVAVVALAALCVVLLVLLGRRRAELEAHRRSSSSSSTSSRS